MRLVEPYLVRYLLLSNTPNATARLGGCLRCTYKITNVCVAISSNLTSVDICPKRVVIVSAPPRTEKIKGMLSMPSPSPVRYLSDPLVRDEQMTLGAKRDRARPC